MLHFSGNIKFKSIPWRISRHEMPERVSPKTAHCRIMLPNRKDLRVYRWDQGELRKDHNVH